MKKFLDNKSILITGGTGSFGKRFVDTVFKKFEPKKKSKKKKKTSLDDVLKNEEK